MGICSSGGDNKETEKNKSNSSQDPKNLLDLSQKTCKQYYNEKESNINRLKEELVKYLNQKDFNSSKEKMYSIIKEEDGMIIYDILNRIIETIKNNLETIISNDECPNELKANLNTIIYSADRLEIKELKEFREIIKQKYGTAYISSVDNNEELLVNEVLVEKLKINILSEQSIKIKLKQICLEKKIDYEFLDIKIQSSMISRNSSIRRINSIFDEPIDKSNLGQSSINLYKKEDNKNMSDIINKYSKQTEDEKNIDPLKSIITLDDNNEDYIKEQGENMFLPYDETIDEECYKINKIENWAESFYNLKSGVLLDKFKLLLSKSEFNTFFEALNYEYGINNHPLDVNKAFEIYKKAANTSTDTLSMYRLYHIYKKDFKKFNIKQRYHVLEKFYIMKCFAYLTHEEKTNQLFKRFYLGPEIKTLLMDNKNIFYKWYTMFFEFLKSNYCYYDIKKDDVVLIESIIYYWFEKKTDDRTNDMDRQLINLAKNGNPNAMYNLVTYYKEEKDFFLYFEKLEQMNYYRSFADYSKELPYEENTIIILRKSIANGYYNHIKYYFRAFMMINNIEDIIKSPSLKDELKFILNYLLDAIILDDIEFLFDYIYLRNVLIKHYDFENEFKGKLDSLLKEIMNYINKFFGANDEENKIKIKSYFINNYQYQLLYTIYGYIYFYGIKGIIQKNYQETLNKYNFILKKDDGFLIDRFYLYYIYMIKNKQRKLNEKNSKESNKKDDKELIELEKKLLNMFYEDLSVEKIKKYPPTFFYYLSRLFRSDTIKTKDLILEYVFLNRASNAKIIELQNVDCQIFEEKYIVQKAKMKIKEKNKEENFKKIKEAKGAINVEGYGEDGMICPICLENKKSIIALPCKHFFCGTCMKRLLDDITCPICRTDIKITFDINLKKETLIKTYIDPFSSGDYNNDEFDVYSRDSRDIDLASL